MHGTSLYAAVAPDEVPPLVRRAVNEAVALGFDLCVHPATGRLLGVLAGGLGPGALVGETGTGTGAGLAWMVAANPDVAYLSVERDPDRAAAARRVFAAHPSVLILTGDAGELFDRGPFDLLVHDGGWGSGKTDPRRIDPTLILRENGVMTVDDYSPMAAWPPTFEGQLDQARIDWLSDDRLLSTEITVAAGQAVLVCRRRPPPSTR